MKHANAPGAQYPGKRNILKHRSVGELLRDWKWILGFSRSQRGPIVLSGCLSLLASGLALAGGLMSKFLVDAISTGNSAALATLIPVMLLLAGVTIVFHALRSQYGAKVGISMENLVHQQVFSRLLKAPWLDLSRFSAGDLLNRLSGDVQTVAGCAVSVLPGIATNLFSLVASLGIILYYDPMLALIGCAGVPVVLVLSRGIMRRQQAHNRQARTLSSQLSSFESEVFRNLDTLKSFGVEDRLCNLLEAHQNRYRDAMLTYQRYAARSHGILSAVNTGVQYLALGYCLWQLWNRRMEFGSVVLFLQLRGMLQAAASGLAGQIPRILSGSVAAQRLRVLTELPPQEPPLPPRALPRNCALRMEGVSLGYQPGNPVLTDVSFHAAPGEIIALTGPSGHGKTTLLRHLVGLLPAGAGQTCLLTPEGGEIPVGPGSRHAFAWVPQGNALLAGTVAENLRLVAPEAEEESLVRVLKLACAWEFVEQLPQGIHTPLGDGGKELSQGQAQRLAIARALLCDASFLLLDEVTSALDPETEAVVLGNLASLGLTCILTTHRPSVLEICDRVYRVENGALGQSMPADVPGL